MRSAGVALACAVVSLCVGGCPAVDAGTTGSPPLGGATDTPVPPPSLLADSAQPVVAPTGPQGMLLDSSGKLVSLDPGPPPPTAIRADRPLQAESPAHEDQSGVTVGVEFKMRGLSGAPKVPEAVPAAIAKAQKLTALSGTVDLFASGRMRWVVTSRAMPLPFTAELRSKYDRYGHVVLWPGLVKYRVLPAGSLRSVLDEGRVDVMPIVPGAVTKGAAGKRLGEVTRGVSIETPVGKVELELASVPEASLGGPLLCRAIVEIVGVDPATPECKSDEIVLAAKLDFFSSAGAASGGIDFEVGSLARRIDMPPGDASCPPAGASFEATGLPDSPEGVFLAPADLEGVRSKPDAKVEPGTNAPSEGIIIENLLDRRAYFVLDGALLALVPPPPGSSRYILGMPRGRYTGEWRTFFGEIIEPAHEIVLPGRFSTAPSHGAADAGVAP